MLSRSNCVFIIKERRRDRQLFTTDPLIQNLDSFWTVSYSECMELSTLPYHNKTTQNATFFTKLRNIEGFRNCCLRIRSPSLYPVELQTQVYISTLCEHCEIPKRLLCQICAASIQHNQLPQLINARVTGMGYLEEGRGDFWCRGCLSRAVDL